jgi:signal peptidase I
MAFFLTLLCPGMGALYLGETLKGALICLIYAAAAGLFVVFWSSLKFFPALPGLVCAVAAFGVTVKLAVSASRKAGRLGSSYILKGVNHPMVYLLVALVFYVLPLGTLVHFTSQRLWTMVWVRGDVMLPTLLDGDLLLVDRAAYRDSEPQKGDVVVIRDTESAMGLAIGRIVALPGDRIEMEDSVPVVNGTAVRRALMAPGAEGDEALASLDVQMRSDELTYAEILGGVSYLTAERARGRGALVEPLRLAESEYFVLHDNRSHFADSRAYGPIQRAQIVGRPLYIAFSADSEGHFRWSRVAKRVQPAPLFPLGDPDGTPEIPDSPADPDQS